MYISPVYFQAAKVAPPILSGVYIFPFVVVLSPAAIVQGVVISKFGCYRLMVCIFVCNINPTNIWSESRWMVSSATWSWSSAAAESQYCDRCFRTIPDDNLSWLGLSLRHNVLCTLAIGRHR